MKIVQGVKTNSISRERLNFWRQTTLCTTLYRNQCFSYRRFLAFWTAILSIWTQVESFGCFLCVKCWFQTLKTGLSAQLNWNFFSRGGSPGAPGVLLDALQNGSGKITGNPKQASNFGGAFDHLFLWIFLCNFHRRYPSIFSILWGKKVKIDQKLKSRVGVLP